MPDIDYTGAQGGLMGIAFAAGCVATSAFWLMISGAIWRLFIEPRIKSLEVDRDKERQECEGHISGLKDRIIQLETMLMLHGPQTLRQAMQSVASETHLAMDDLRKAKDR